MSTVTRLSVPSFDLVWVTLMDGKEPMVLIPGGGGSTKSGVKNQIQVAKYEGARGFTLMKSFMTDAADKSNLCSAIATGILEGKAIVCAVVDDTCLIFRATRAEDGELNLTKMTEFKADFNKEYASVNCCLVASKHILTGGEDHTCRLWSLSQESADESSSWNVKQIREMKGHSAPIMAIARHPTRPWILTASKDGSCKIFDASNGQGNCRSSDFKLKRLLHYVQSSSISRQWMGRMVRSGRQCQWSVAAVRFLPLANTSIPYKAEREARVT